MAVRLASYLELHEIFIPNNLDSEQEAIQLLTPLLMILQKILGTQYDNMI